MAILKFADLPRGKYMRVYVNVEDKRWKKYDIDFEKIANAAVTAKYKDAEVSITLVGDSEIRKINKKSIKIRHFYKLFHK